MGRRRRLVDRPSQPDPAPVVARTAHPVAWLVALHMAGGDHRRLVVDDKGRVTIANNPQR